ncbi:MAG: hypothetical protein ACR2OU_10480, partial [Thermomicrobiales bacterium]
MKQIAEVVPATFQPLRGDYQTTLDAHWSFATPGIDESNSSPTDLKSSLVECHTSISRFVLTVETAWQWLLPTMPEA